MIDERGLLSAMKSTWRSEGYTVAGYREDGERVLCIHGASWLAAIPYSAISRKVLALLVEHLGEIPDGAAWTVRKGAGVQGQIMDVVLTRLDGLRRHIEECEAMGYDMSAYRENKPKAGDCSHECSRCTRLHCPNRTTQEGASS